MDPLKGLDIIHGALLVLGIFLFIGTILYIAGQKMPEQQKPKIEE